MFHPGFYDLRTPFGIWSAGGSTPACWTDVTFAHSDTGMQNTVCMV